LVALTVRWWRRLEVLEAGGEAHHAEEGGAASAAGEKVRDGADEWKERSVRRGMGKKVMCSNFL
jgi:hypothetical protein